ncbi:MAG: hypothetical protein ACXWKD_18740, partial [Caldimonas sp.]
MSSPGRPKGEYRSAQHEGAAVSPPAKKLRSAIVTEGLDRAPHRAFLRATGVADEDFGKPFVG